MLPPPRRLGGPALFLLAFVLATATAAQTPPLAKPPAEGRAAEGKPSTPDPAADPNAKAATKPAGGVLAPAEAAPGPKTGSVTGLPLPRFVSLAADKVNARVGPGTNYPITWVYARRNLPVEVVAEYELYRKIRDHDGTESWVHKNLLSGRRYALITGGTRVLREKPEETAAVALMAESGVQGRVLRCKGEWCQVEIQGNKGYAPRTFLWGVYADETIE